MKFGPLPVAEAAGALLAHSLALGGRRLAKGHRLTHEDVAAAHGAGLAELIVARLEPGDVGEDAAATSLAVALAGVGVTVSAPRHGRVDLLAARDGLFVCDAAAVDAVNAADEAIGLGTIWPGRPVRAGATIATVKIIPYALPGDVLTRACAVAGRGALGVREFMLPALSLIQTRLPGQPDKLFAATVEATRQRAIRLGATLVRDEICDHEEAALAGRIAASDDAAVLLIAGASATVDRRDVIPAAIVRAGGVVERLGMPVDPGNLAVPWPGGWPDRDRPAGMCAQPETQWDRSGAGTDRGGPRHR
ncbi:hypothetical protein [Sphingomonas sp. KC8]|uniref:hypothetical protein n=1 Tax=Sphingomonas sp. KC8 TaxID=1030157 RepID=UPI0002488A6D|nr:hypothetical protein [Sphingomonas sp. KC8]ARS25839.1 molybdopterin biosynthesis protein [Sphingomonas sp. KC8]